MLLKSGEKLFNEKNAVLLLSFAEAAAGILSDTYSLTVTGLFSAMYFFGFSFSRFAKNKVAAVVVKIVSLVTVLYIGLISFFEIVKTVGYYDSTPRFWIFPVIAALFIVRFALKINFADGAGKSRTFSPFAVFLYAAVLICTAVSYFYEFYFEPALALSLSAFEFYMLLKNIKL